MTIEEKVRSIALRLWQDSQGTSMYPNKEGNKQINQATQAILALIKPMSQKRLADIIDLWWRNQSEQRKLSEVILAEWQKGLK